LQKQKQKQTMNVNESYRDFDFFNGTVKATIVKSFGTLELTGRDFNHILQMRRKTSSTLQGLEDTVQVTSRPKMLFMPAEKHRALISELQKRNVVCMAPDNKEEGLWSTFALRTKSVDGDVLFDALTAIGATELRLVTFGEKMPIASFCNKIGPYLDDAADASFVFDLTSNIVCEQRNNIPLLHVVPETDAHHAATLNLLGRLGSEDIRVPSGSVRISHMIDKDLLPRNPRRNAAVQYMMIYPTLTHLLKAMGVPDHLPELPTQERARRFRQKLQAWLATLTARDMKGALDAVLGKYRIEVRCTFKGSGANLCAFLTRNSGCTTLADVKRISGVDVGVSFVSRDAYINQLKSMFRILEDPACLIGYGDKRHLTPVPDVAKARIADIINFMGLTVGLFDSISLTAKLTTWELLAPDQKQPDKDAIAKSKYLWEAEQQNVENNQRAANPPRRSHVLHVPPQAPPVQADRNVAANDGGDVDEDDGNDDERIAEVKRDMVTSRFGPLRKLCVRHNGRVVMSEDNEDLLAERIWAKYGEQWRDHISTNESAEKARVERNKRSNERRKAQRRAALQPQAANAANGNAQQNQNNNQNQQ
jgi:hypothetical protein